MKKTMFIALSLLSSVAMAETKFNFSGDAYVRFYNINAHNVGTSSTQAFSQFFRLNVDAKPDEHLTIKTGLVLSGDNWNGDSSKPVSLSGSSIGGSSIGGTNDNGSGNSSISHLDHAQIDYSNDGWITSVGRIAVSSPGNFLTSDDRRDRIQVLKIFPSYDVLAFVYDKRATGSITDKKDDLDMYSVNYYGSWNQFKYAFQTGYWRTKKFNSLGTNLYNGVVNLDNIKQITPQLSTTLLGVNADLYYTILWGGTAYYKDDHHSMALKLSKDLEVLNVEYETIVTRDGGLIAGGFDTLSSIINNSMDHNVSQTNIRNIGFGLGNKNADEYVSMLKFSKKFNND